MLTATFYGCFGLVSRIDCQVIFWVKLFDCFYKEDSHAYPNILWMFWVGLKDWLPSHFLGQIVWLFLQGGLPCLPQHFMDVLGWFQGLTAMSFFGSNCLTVFTRRIPLLAPTFYRCFWLVSRIDCHVIFWVKLFDCFYKEDSLAYPNILRMFWVGFKDWLPWHFLGQIVWLFLQGGLSCLPQHFTDVLGWFKGLTAMTFFGVKLFDCFYKEDSLAYPNILQMFWVGFKDWLPCHFLGQIVWLFLQGGLSCLPQHFTDVLGWFQGLTAMTFLGSNCLTVFTRRIPLLIPTFYGCFGLVSRVDSQVILGVKLFDCFYKEDSLAYPNILWMFWVGFKDWLPWHFLGQIVWLFLQGGLPCLPQHFMDVLGWFKGLTAKSFFGSNCLTVFTRRTPLLTPTFYGCFGLVSRIDCHVIFWVKLFDCFYKEDSLAYPNILRMFWVGFKDWLPWHFFGQIVWLFLQGGLSCLPQHFTDVLGWFKGLTAMTFFGVKLFDCFYKEDSLAYPNILQMFWVGLKDWLPCHFLGQIVWLFLQGGLSCLPQHFTDVLGWFQGLTAMTFFGVKLFDCFYKEDSLAYRNILQMFWVGFKDWLPWHFWGQIVWLFLQGGLPCLPQHFTDVFGWFQGLTAMTLFGVKLFDCFYKEDSLAYRNILQMFWVGFKDWLPWHFFGSNCLTVFTRRIPLLTPTFYRCFGLV